MCSLPNRLAVALTAALFLTAPPARADTISLVLQDSGTPTTYNPNGGAAVTVGAGPFNWVQATPSNASFPTSLATYCIDLDKFIQQGGTFQFAVQTDLTLAPTIGTADKAAAVTELFDRDYLNSRTSVANSTAFQIALWELVYDGASSKSLGAGRIQSDNAQAQALLDQLGTSYSNHDLAGQRLTAFTSDTSQGQIGVTPASAVPAPPAVLLAGIGFLGLVGRFRLTRGAN